MRRMLDTFAGLMNGDLPQVGALVEDVPVTEGVTADVVVPEGEGPHPVLVYLHGGGWICGSPRTHRKLACRFRAPLPDAVRGLPGGRAVGGARGAALRR
jgi:acetyl esterase